MALRQRLHEIIYMTLDQLQLKFSEIFIGPPLRPVIVVSVFMLGKRWHLGDLQEKVPVMKLLLGKEADVSKSLRLGGWRYDMSGGAEKTCLRRGFCLVNVLNLGDFVDRSKIGVVNEDWGYAIRFWFSLIFEKGFLRNRHGLSYLVLDSFASISKCGKRIF